MTTFKSFDPATEATNWEGEAASPAQVQAAVGHRDVGDDGRGAGRDEGLQDARAGVGGGSERAGDGGFGHGSVLEIG